MKKLLILFVTIFALTSCGTLQSVFSRDVKYIDGKIIQTHSSHAGLVMIEEGMDYMIVMLVDPDKVFYDRKRVHGYYRLVDTYSYYNKDDIRKTVPVYVKRNYTGNYQRYLLL